MVYKSVNGTNIIWNQIIFDLEKNISMWIIMKYFKYNIHPNWNHKNKDWQSITVSVRRRHDEHISVINYTSDPVASSQGCVSQYFWCNPARMETVILYFVTCLYCAGKNSLCGKNSRGLKIERPSCCRGGRSRSQPAREEEKRSEGDVKQRKIFHTLWTHVWRPLTEESTALRIMLDCHLFF